MEINSFIEELKKLGITPTEKQLNQLDKYYELLIQYNSVMNLTGITEKKQVYLKHFYDSLCIVKVIDLSSQENLCDVGTGAGFPGIVLKIFYPNLKITLLDSLNKRIEFLNIVIKNLELNNIEAIHCRAEEYALQNREKYDVVTSRAVTKLNILSELSIPMVKVNKYFIPLKANLTEELEESKNALKKLNSKIIKIEHFLLPVEESNRTIIKIQKLSSTQKLFPRKYSVIKKNPL